MLYTKRRQDGRHYFYWRAKWIDTSGRRHTKRIATGIVDDGSAAARNAATTIGHRLQAPLAAGGERAARPARTLKQALEALIKAQQLAARHDASITIITQKSLHLFEFFGPAKLMHEITEDEIATYAHAARAERAVATVSRELLVLQQAYKAVRVELPPFPKLPAPPKGRARVLEVDEQEALLAEIPARYRLHVLVLLQLGCRRSELWKLGEIDWVRRFVRIHGTKTHAADRTAPIPALLFSELMKRRATWDGLEPWEHADRMLKAAAERAGIEPISCNDLRRTYATFMARAGVQALQLAKYMGTSVKQLERVYARLELPGDHDHAAVEVGVPQLPGAHSVLTDRAPGAERTPEVPAQLGSDAENTDVFAGDWPTVQ